GHKEAEGVIRKDDEVHSRQVSRKKREHPSGRLLVLTITECKQARSRAADIDHGQKERCKSIDPEMCAKPRQAEWQCYAGCWLADNPIAPPHGGGQGEDREGSVNTAACTPRP